MQYLKYFSKITAIVFFMASSCHAQYTHQDTLRGSIGPERAWWDVQHYAIEVTPDYNAKTITGRSTIRYKVLPGQRSDYLQIDLQQPLKIDTIFYDGKLYINYPAKPYYNTGNVWHIPLPKAQVNSIHSIALVYHGNPRIAKTPPWDGGWIFAKDEKGRPWMSVACQGLGASVWYPCKDHQSDEPDSGASLTITVADSLVAVGNGRMTNKISNGNGTTSWAWEVKNPINNYNLIPYIGKYDTWHEDFAGEKGKLDCDFWVLDYNINKAKLQFGRDVPLMLKCFEHWFGPYPFYEDGYKLVESPHLGMEHQSAVAYGNHYLNGYLGSDLSNTGWGTKWDYIIVHESGHEWFGNNITTNDIADMWIHEGFTDYSETLFVECNFGKQAGDEYTQGIRRNIDNDRAIIGPYGVNKEGSGDMYAKGSNIIHTIRQVINDDTKFKEIMRGLNKDFYHKTINSTDVEKYFSQKSGKDFSKVFDQYLRTTKIPVFEYQLSTTKSKPGTAILKYRWANVIDGFAMPVRIFVDDKPIWITPVAGKAFATTTVNGTTLDVDRNFYVTVKKL
jgi:aminopeptidase N